MGIAVFRNGKISFNRTGSSYDGEKDMGSLKNWTVFDADANKLILSTYGDLVERSGTLYNTWAPARGAINKQTDYAVGPGLIFRSQPDWETLGWSKERGRDWGKEFQKIVDSYYRHLGFYQKQGFLFRTGLYGGDSLLMFERKNGELTDLIETQNNQIDWEYNDSGYTLGIKHDSLLRRSGIRKTDGTTLLFKDSNDDQNVIQFYIKELARQLRGFPLVYSIINLARNDDTLNDAVMQRAVMESILIGTAKTDNTDIGKQLRNMAAQNKANKSGGVASFFKKEARATDLGSGNILNINPGEEFTFNDMKTPSNNYAPFKEVTLGYVGMATGTPPEVIKSMYSTSFTAHKGALNDFVKSFMYKRSIMGSNVCDIVNAEILKDAVMQGFIQAPGFLSGNWRVKQAYLRGMYLGPIPGHINPLVEVKADELAVKNTFKLRSDVARMNGNEYENFQSEWAAEQEEFTNSAQNYAEKVAKQEELEVIEDD